MDKELAKLYRLVLSGEWHILDCDTIYTQSDEVYVSIIKLAASTSGSFATVVLAPREENDTRTL